MLCGLTADQVEVGFLQFGGDRPTVTRADLAAIQLLDRRDFGGGAGEEGLVGDIDFITGDALFYQLQAVLLGQGQDGVA